MSDKEIREGDVVQFTDDFTNEPHAWVTALQVAIPDASSGGSFYTNQLKQVTAKVIKFDGEFYWCKYWLVDREGNRHDITTNNWKWEIAHVSDAVANDPDRYRKPLF